MAPKNARNFKTKAKRVSRSSFEPIVEFDRTRFHTLQNEQKIETLIKYRSIWRERQINLDELYRSVHRNLGSRKWFSLCSDLEPPPTTLIRDFYLNLSTHSDDSGGHYLTTSIRGEEFWITKQIVSKALCVPLVRKPTYPYTDSPPMDDVMTFLCGRSVTWGTEPRLNSRKLTEINYILFKIACHIFPISRVHTIPIDRCVFLYALIIDGSICFPSLFIQTIVEVHRSKSRNHSLYFSIFIHRILNFLELENFHSLELIHIIAPIRVSFLR